MKKRVMLLGCILMLLVSSAFAQDEIPIYINDVLLENSPPVLDFSEYRLASDSTPRYEAKLPLRAVFEGIGATVEWIPKNGNIRISMDSKSILCDTYSNYIDAIDELTGKYIVLEGYLHHGYYWNIDGHMYIPDWVFSNFIDMFGFGITSDEDNHIINISRKKY